MTTPATPAKPTFYLRRIRLNSGGYDSGGRYYGQGMPLYEYQTDDIGDSTVEDVIRAHSREHAKDIILVKFPTARFAR